MKENSVGERAMNIGSVGEGGAASSEQRAVMRVDGTSVEASVSLATV